MWDLALSAACLSHMNPTIKLCLYHIDKQDKLPNPFSVKISPIKSPEQTMNFKLNLFKKVHCLYTTMGCFKEWETRSPS